MVDMLGFFYLIALAFILVASYIDIKTREVPDLLNYGLVFLAITARTIFSLSGLDLAGWDYTVLINGLIGGLIGFAIGAGMYYSGQWGGGDTKLLTGLGILIGVPFEIEIGFFLIFVINILFAGAAYALVLSLISALMHWRKFLAEAELISKGLKKMKIILLIYIIIISAAIYFLTDEYLKVMLFTLSILLVMMLYLYIFVKAVEKTAMLKVYPVGKLTEGDWIAKDVFFGKKYITGPKDLGISAEKILLLKKYKIKSVLVKEGIPFVPSFLIAFVLTYYAGNWIVAFL